MVKRKSKDLPQNWNYEATVDRVEEILAAILFQRGRTNESGDLELAEVFSQFAVAVDNLQQCDRFLNEQQQQVDLLLETLGD